MAAIFKCRHDVNVSYAKPVGDCARNVVIHVQFKRHWDLDGHQPAHEVMRTSSNPSVVSCVQLFVNASYLRQVHLCDPNNRRVRNELSVTKNCGTLLRESELRRLDGVKRASDDNLPQILVTLE